MWSSQAQPTWRRYQAMVECSGIFHLWLCHMFLFQKGVSSLKAPFLSHHSLSHASNIECIALFDVCVSWLAADVIYELDLGGSTIVCRYSAFSEIYLEDYLGLLECCSVLHKSSKLVDLIWTTGSTGRRDGRTL